MVRIDPDAYVFTRLDPATGAVTRHTLAELFDMSGKRPDGRPNHTLLVYHFMFAPDWDAGCSGCAMSADHFGSREVLRHLASRGVGLVAVSRQDVGKIEAWRAKVRAGQTGGEGKEGNGSWSFPWVSSGGEDNTFNYDFWVTLPDDESGDGSNTVNAASEGTGSAEAMYNFTPVSELRARGKGYLTRGEQPGTSVFWRDVDGGDGAIYHTYSAFTRGCEKLLTTLMLLDMTPGGRMDEPYGPASFALSYEKDQ